MRYVVYFLLSIVMLASCDGKKETSKYQKEKVIMGMLAEELDIEDKIEGKSYLIVIPPFNCKGCVKVGLNTIAQMDLKEKTSSIMIICGEYVELPDQIKKNFDYKRDEGNLIDTYKWELESINIFQMSGDEIAAIHQYGAKNVEEISNFTFE